MAGYIDEAELKAFGITDPAAEDLIEQASRIIDMYVVYPENTTGDYIGWRFPRLSDDGVVPTSVKNATLEQILYMMQEGMVYVRKGGDDKISMAVGVQSYTKQSPNNTPLLAPLAKAHLRRLMTRVGQMDVEQ